MPSLFKGKKSRQLEEKSRKLEEWRRHDRDARELDRQRMQEERTRQQLRQRDYDTEMIKRRKSQELWWSNETSIRLEYIRRWEESRRLKESGKSPMPVEAPRISEPLETRKSPMQFTYKRLEKSGDIRLIKVPLGYDGKIKDGTPGLSIEHVNLTARPLYTALSYTWGPPEESEDLTIDNHTLSVQANLRPMIQALSSPNQSRYFWIDAICINQDDDGERGQQVMLMSEIYSKANEVIAYLSGKNHKSYASQAHYYIHHQPDTYQTRIHLSEDHFHQLLSIYDIIAKIHTAAEQSGHENLNLGPGAERFFENDYFHRRWIIQEIGLARSVVIHCDGYEFPMGMLDQYFKRPDAMFLDSAAARLCRLRQIGEKMSPLKNLLYDNANAMCSDPRDRIYALLSLTLNAKKHLPVDYNIQLHKLLISAVQVCSTYEQMSRSRCLSLACFLRRQLSIPFASVACGMRDQIAFEKGETGHHLCLSVHVRAVVKSNRIAPVVEDYLHRLRPFLPSISHYPNIHLNSTTEYGDATLVLQEFPFSRGDEIEGKEIESSNQWAFSFKPTNAGKDPPPYGQDLLAGMCSAPIEVDDEVWQFPGTPFAFIARTKPQGYELVGRAFVIKIDQDAPSFVKDSLDSKAAANANYLHDVDRAQNRQLTSERKLTSTLMSIVDVFAHQGDEDGHGDNKVIAVTATDLLRLMLWAENGWDEKMSEAPRESSRCPRCAPADSDGIVSYSSACPPWYRQLH